MRGADVMQESLFTEMTLEDFVPTDHPLRCIGEIVNTAPAAMDATFEALYADPGRDSIPPAQLLRDLLLRALYGFRGERLLCERLACNMAFRWFVGLGLDEVAWDHSIHTKNRDRLIEHEVMRELFERVLDQARAKDLLSSEHCSVDGTLLEAFAAHKSFVPKDGPPPPSAGPPSRCWRTCLGNPARPSAPTRPATSRPSSQAAARSA